MMRRLCNLETGWVMKIQRMKRIFCSLMLILLFTRLFYSLKLMVRFFCSLIKWIMIVFCSLQLLRTMRVICSLRLTRIVMIRCNLRVRRIERKLCSLGLCQMKKIYCLSRESETALIIVRKNSCLVMENGVLVKI